MATGAAREKLIRDLIPQLAAAEGRSLALRRAEPSEMARLLGLKLVEETHEVLDALRVANQDGLLDELADLQTVIDAIAARHGLSSEDINARVEAKRRSRGGFDAGLVLRDAQLPPARLHSGGSTSLLDALKREFEACRVARIAVAFVMNSGLDLLEGAARAALLRGAELRLLTTDYLGITEPEALERLCGWHGALHAKVYSQGRRSFHPKAYLFERADGSGRAFIGSANLSRMGLVEGVEWTWTVLDIDASDPMHELTARFEELFHAAPSQPLSPHWIRAYEQRRVVANGLFEISEPRVEFPAELPAEPPQPREVQRLALGELERLRYEGESRALVVAATGLGKTFLAAFDAHNADRVLFIAHQEILLRQAEEAFSRVYPSRSRGWLANGRNELDREIVLATIQTLSRAEHLSRPELARFDYVIVDEFHHAAADSYLRAIEALSPRFLLGLTATPFRGDQRDLLSLCDGNLAYQVGLFEAIAFGWLVPFRYHGVADVVAYTDDLLNSQRIYDATRLTLRLNTTERADLALKHYRGHAAGAAPGFCVSIDHANFMARHFCAAGIKASAVHSGPDSIDRTRAIRQLSNGKIQILFTVDLFNEGVDIPEVNLVMFLRPTESMTVFLQQLGRGLRLHPGKSFLTVLDFIGNYRQVHLKLPLLAGQDLTKDQDPGRALKSLLRWLSAGIRPDGLPEGVEVSIEPVALSALRESLQRASPLRELVLSDLREIAERVGGTPTLTGWQQMGRYSLRTARNALGVDRWHRVLESAGLLTDEQRQLEREVGDFLREIEFTAMTRSFKMVVLKAMCNGKIFRSSITGTELVQAFRSYFGEDRHRNDVLGTDVADIDAVDAGILLRYIERNPISAWIGRNTAEASRYFAWQESTQTLRYIGPLPAGDALDQRFTGAVLDRVNARLHEYWQRPGPGRMVFSVIPAGRGLRVGDPGDEPDARKVCIMFGDDRQGLPTGWQLVVINGKHLYGNFDRVALNVLKAQPSNARDEPNRLTEELRQLFGGALPARARVRLVKQSAASVWAIHSA